MDKKSLILSLTVEAEKPLTIPVAMQNHYFDTFKLIFS